MPGWSLLVDAISSGLRFFIDLAGSTGWGIVFFTVFVKLCLVPLTLPALRNARKQQELAPLVRDIQKKHKGDRTAASAEQMELYRQYGFNPLSGCLPMLVQMPIFFALWTAINGLKDTELAKDGFLWIKNISDPDPIHLLPVLAALAQFLQTRMSMQPRSQIVDPQQRQMNLIMQFMPVMVIFFGWQIAAGAVLYWFVSSLFSAAMQWFITGWGSLTELLPFLPQRQLKSLLPPPNPEGYRKGSGKAGYMQRFQERMIEAQRQQEAQRKGKTLPAIVPQDTAPQPAAIVEPAPPDGMRLTEDAWQLPGAPGSTGRAAFATNSPSSSNGATPGDRTQPGGPRPGNRNKNRKRK